MNKHHPKLNISTSHIVCPRCMEVLVREDIEGFGHCPYCNFAFELSTEIEDFLLSPVVTHWTSQQHPNAPIDDLPLM